MTRTFVGLDVLRFGLALYLMTYHTIHFYPATASLPFSDLLSNGGVATSTFFILSGFILAHVYFGESNTLKRGTRDFLVKRLTNLYPVNWMSLLLFVVVVAGSGSALRDYSYASMVHMDHPVTTLGPVALAFNRVLALLMLDTWNPLYVTLNPPAWSLSVLMFFYLCFPFIAPRLLASSRKARWLVAVWVLYLIPPAIAAGMHWYSVPVAGIVTSNPLLRLPEFAAGILFYGLYRSGSLGMVTHVRWWKAGALAFFAVCFAAAAWLTNHSAQFWLYVVHNGGMLPAELALIWVFAESFNRAKETVRWISARLGNAALSIFAIHLSLFYVFIKVERLMSVKVPIVNCVKDLHACLQAYKAAPEPSLMFYPLYLLLTVIIAVYFQEIVVVKIRNALRRRLLMPRATSPDGNKGVLGL